MKTLIAVLFVVLFAVTAVYAKPPIQPRDGAGAVVTDFSPDPAKASTLTVVKGSAVDMSNDLRWGLYNTGSGCITRSGATSTVTGTTEVIPANAWFYRGVNRGAAGFRQFSGCTGNLHRQ
jgi:hypothetical protein